MNSHCKECAAKQARAWRERKTAESDFASVERELKRTYPDALAYSRGVCSEVEALVRSRIGQFERKHGVEAPPHLVAIREIASSFVEQHPVFREPKGRAATCIDCGAEFRALSKTKTRCALCWKERRRAVDRIRRERNIRRAAEAEGRVYQPRKRRYDPAEDLLRARS